MLKGLYTMFLVIGSNLLSAEVSTATEVEIDANGSGLIYNYKTLSV